jgi:uncharacterized protein YaaW (UPF0174 family)
MREFHTIVSSATEEQRKTLAKLTESAFGDAPDTLCNHIRYLRAGSIGQLVYNDSWKQVVTDVADHVGIDWLSVLADRQWRDLETEKIENAVVTKLFQTILDHLSPEQQRQLALAMKDKSDDAQLIDWLLGGGGAFAAPSGVSSYLLASTVLGSLTQAFGISLPFAVDLGMSQAIAALLGPTEWAELAGSFLARLNQPNWKRLTLAVVYVAVMRNTKVANLAILSRTEGASTSVLF